MLPRVMLVEDDDVIREIYAMKFELEGFPTMAAENGQAALDVMGQFNPEIILLDMMMPVMGGLEFMRALKSQVSVLPHIIVFSNISAPHQVDAVMRLGAKAHWTKSDYTPERVARELMNLWRQQADRAQTA